MTNTEAIRKRIDVSQATGGEMRAPRAFDEADASSGQSDLQKTTSASDATARHSNLLEALRLGLDQPRFDGWDSQAPASYACRDSAACEERPALGDIGIADDAGAAIDLRVAHMVQEMAGFGVRAGEGEWKDRLQQVDGRIEYYAA